MKYLGINLKETKDLYTKIYKTLLQELRKTDRKTFYVHGLENLTLLKQPFYPKHLQVQCNP